MANLAPQGKITNMADPMVSPSALTISKTTTGPTIYVRYQNSQSQFSWSQTDGYHAGGIHWYYDSSVTDPPSLLITFKFVGDVEKLTDPSPTSNVSLGTWTTGATEQTCTVQAVATGATPDKSNVKTKNGDKHDLKIVVTPQN